VSAFREAVRAQLLAEVECWKCGARNLPAPASPTIDVDLACDSACCTTCGAYGPIAKFKPKEKR
jgi:hypothetical protein